MSWINVHTCRKKSTTATKASLRDCQSSETRWIHPNIFSYIILFWLYTQLPYNVNNIIMSVMAQAFEQYRLILNFIRYRWHLGKRMDPSLPKKSSQGFKFYSYFPSLIHTFHILCVDRNCSESFFFWLVYICLCKSCSHKAAVYFFILPWNRTPVNYHNSLIKDKKEAFCDISSVLDQF